MDKYKSCMYCGHESSYNHEYGKGKHKYYICNNCIGNKEDYSEKNETYRGKSARKHFQNTFSFEFETGDIRASMYELIDRKFLPTADGSINGIEWKSPIYNNRRVLLEDLKFIDQWAYLVDEDCGTHLHVGTRHLNFIAHHLEQIFGDLTDRLCSNIEETEEFWGRFFNNYASSELDSGDRYSWVNTATSTETTIEFRVPVFWNWKQYYRMASFCIDVVRTLDDMYNKIPEDQSCCYAAYRMNQMVNRKYDKAIKIMRGW